MTSAGAFGSLADVMQSITFVSQQAVGIFMTAMDGGGTYDGDIGDTYDFEFVYVTD